MNPLRTAARGSLAMVLLAVTPLGLVAAEDSPGAAALATKEPRVILMSPFLVQVSVLGSIGVTFTLQGEDATDTAAPIFWATVTDVPRGGPGERAGLQAGDELIRLNGRLIRGLTVKQFAALIRHESKRGNLIWSVRRSVMGLSFTTLFNGKAAPGAGPFATLDKLQKTETGADAAGEAPVGVNHPERIEQMDPVTVQASRSLAIEVRFMLNGDVLAVSIDDPIREARVVDVQGEGAGLRDSLQTGDALIRLNGTAIRGLTLRQLGELVAATRNKQGDLMWEVRRGLTTFSRRFNGRWIKPLPGMETKS